MIHYQIINAPADDQMEGYQPYGACADLWMSRVHECIISGPAETGKTRGALELLNLLLWKYPRCQAVMLRKQYVDMPSSCIETYEKQVLGDVLGDRGPVTKYGGEKPQFYDYPNGSRLWVAGLDKPGKVLSSERDIIYVNQAEELSLEDWETLTTRATGRAGNVPYARIFGDCNPGPRDHWILERANSGKLVLLHSRHEDNPTLYDPQSGQLTERGQVTMAVLDDLTGVRLQRLRYGKWVSVEGQIYPQYDPAIHLIDPFEIPANWRRFRCIDFGLDHPFVCGWWAVDHDGRMYLYRQIYMSGRTVATHSTDILRLTFGLKDDDFNRLSEEERKRLFRAVQMRRLEAISRIGNVLDVDAETAAIYYDGIEQIETTVCDHDAEDRLTLAENGIPNIPAYKSVSTGIDKVQDRLKVQIDGKPRLFIFKNSLVEVDQSLKMAHKPFAAEQEFDGYIWANNVKKEQPVKKDDHGMDMIRYGVMYLDGPKAQKEAFTW